MRKAAPVRRSLLSLVVLGGMIPGLSWSQLPALLDIRSSHGTYGVARPWHLAAGPTGEVFVADLAERRVFAFTADGAPVTSWTCAAMAPLD